MLYFAYGSNLHAVDLAKYCAEHGHAPLLLEGHAAHLPDHTAAFHYYSKSRQGGALDVAAARGHACPGALFDLGLAQVAVLDEKESAGVNYERREVSVCSGGALLSAFTYGVRQERRGDFVAPTQEYFDIACAGYASFQHDDENLRRAAENRETLPVRRVFVYGTLMRGECRQHLLQGGVAKRARLERMSLVDLAAYGDYPGMRASTLTQPGLDDVGVHGEVHEFDAERVSALLMQLDEVEDFHGYDDVRNASPRSMYERVLCRVDGELAWTYLVRPAFDGPRIESGDWRRR